MTLEFSGSVPGDVVHVPVFISQDKSSEIHMFGARQVNVHPLAALQRNVPGDVRKPPRRAGGKQEERKQAQKRRQQAPDATEESGVIRGQSDASVTSFLALGVRRLRLGFPYPLASTLRARKLPQV